MNTNTQQNVDMRNLLVNFYLSNNATVLIKVFYQDFIRKAFLNERVTLATIIATVFSSCLPSHVQAIILCIINMPLSMFGRAETNVFRVVCLLDRCLKSAMQEM